jgi:hypothetical protein
VEPREAEIATMKEQVKKMDSELEHYHKVVVVTSTGNC